MVAATRSCAVCQETFELFDRRQEICSFHCLCRLLRMPCGEGCVQCDFERSRAEWHASLVIPDAQP